MVNQVKLISPRTRLAQSLHRLLQLEYFPVTVLIIINLIIGLITNHYGMGWDDHVSYLHGKILSLHTANCSWTIPVTIFVLS